MNARIFSKGDLLREDKSLSFFMGVFSQIRRRAQKK